MTEQGPVRSVIDSFSQYVDERKQYLANLVTFFEGAYPVVMDTDEANRRLTVFGRPDLVIAEKAEMKPYDSLELVIKETNNFSPSFGFVTGRITTNRVSYGMTFQDEQRVSVTKEELEDLRNRQVTWENSPLWVQQTHAITPAFQRMLVLFPEFTIPFVLSASKKFADGIGNPDGEYKFELFVAYQFMSNLVDANDRGIKNEKGEIDSLYLCR